jgi:DNA-binding transcriptional MerR regulator
MPSELRRLNRTFTIGQLCREFKTTPRALRFYEDKGLLEPARVGLARVYSYRDRARLQLILRGKQVGLSLAEIRQILSLYGKDSAAQNATALKFFKERLAAFEKQRAEIEAAMDTLRTACAKLEADLAAADPALLNQESPVRRPQRQVEYAFAR